MVFYRKERGQGMVEYALLIALLAVVVLFLIAVLGDTVSNLYSYVIEKLPMH